MSLRAKSLMDITEQISYNYNSLSYLKKSYKVETDSKIKWRERNTDNSEVRKLSIDQTKIC